MIASVGIGEYGRLKSCLEAKTNCSGMTGQTSGIRCFLAAGQSIIRPQNAADRLEAMTSESVQIPSFQAKHAAKHSDNDGPQTAGMRHAFSLYGPYCHPPQCPLVPAPV